MMRSVTVGFPRRATRGASADLRRAETWFLIALVLSQVYYFHRWVFKYGDPGTSPTYAPTPAIWQAGKYFLIAFLTVAVIVSARARWFSVQSSGMGLALAIYFWWVLILALASAAFGGSPTTLVKGTFFLPLVLTMHTFYRGRSSIDRILRVGGVLVIYNIIFEAWEIFQFDQNDRLPGLGYPNGGLVRFGAALDDPNGFGLFIVLPLLVLLAGWPLRLRLSWRLIIAAACLYMLVRAISYTATLGLIVGVAAFVAIGRQMTKGLAVLIGLLGAVAYLLVTGALNGIITLKAASAAGRFNLDSTIGDHKISVKGFFEGSPLSWLLGYPKLAPGSETDFLRIGMNFGLPVALLVYGLVLASVRRGAVIARGLRILGCQQEANLFAAFTAYVTAYGVASLGVPCLDVFPSNLFF